MTLSRPIALGVFALPMLLGIVSCQRTDHAASTVSIPILMYHKIGDEGNDKWWVDATTFDAQLRCLREQGYESVLPADLANDARGLATLPARPVVITFDDGYRNVVQQAEPILKRNGFRAIVYLPTSRIGDRESDRREVEGTPCLVWPEIIAAQARGTLHFGSHSHAHRDLRFMNDFADDIRTSARVFADHVGSPPDSFCYPFGRYRPETVDAVRTAGFTTAMTCHEGVAETATSGAAHPLELPRVHVIGGRYSFSARLNPACPTLQIALTHEGPDRRIAPCVRLGGGDTRHWIAPVRLGSGTTPLDWPEIKAPARKPVHLEIWDAHRVLRLYETTLTPAAAPSRSISGAKQDRIPAAG